MWKKGTLIIILLLSNCYIIRSQPVTQEWVKSYSGPSNDLYGPFLAVDKQGNSYIAGTHVVNDSINILCIKYNTLGVQQWATLYKYPGEGYYAPSGLAIDTSGNAYVTSIYGQNAFSTFNSLLVKFNNLNGSVIWTKRYIGQYGWSEPLDIKIDRINNIYVTGWSDTSHLLIKYNTNGDSIWVRKFHPPGVLDLAYACTIDDSLNVILTGRRRYCSGICFDTVFTAKYNPTGILRWISTYHYDNVLNYGKKIVADQFGNVYIGGQSRISGYLVYLTLKYDRNGVQQWARIYDPPGAGDNYISDIAINRIQNFCFVTGIVYAGVSIGASATIKYNITNGDSIWVRRNIGTSYSSGSWSIRTDSSGNSYIGGGITATSSSSTDFMTLKYSEQGNQMWIMTYNAPFNGVDGARTLELDNQNNVYVLGYSQASSQVSDYVLIKYSQFSGIQTITQSKPTTYKLNQNFPNPFNPTTKIRFSSPKNSLIQLRVFDVLGRIKEIIVNENLHPSEYEIVVNASNYASGVYFYQLIADGNIIDTKKFIITK